MARLWASKRVWKLQRNGNHARLSVINFPSTNQLTTQSKTTFATTESGSELDKKVYTTNSTPQFLINADGAIVGGLVYFEGLLCFVLEK